MAHCDVIETVDRPRLAEALAREMERTGRRVTCYIEVNTGEEPQKAGILPGAADAFIRDCRDRLGLPIEGLMCIPPRARGAALHFALLREIARRNGLAVLSMGMSADFETAIRFGATHVRVGTAIFGARRAAADIAAILRPANHRTAGVSAGMPPVMAGDHGCSGAAKSGHTLAAYRSGLAPTTARQR